MNSELIEKANKILIVTSPRSGGTYLLNLLSYPITNRVRFHEPIGDEPKVADGEVVWIKKKEDDSWRVLSRVVVKTHVVDHIRIHSEGPHPPRWPYNDKAKEKAKQHLKTWMKMFDYTIFLKRRDKFLQTMSFCRAQEWTRLMKNFQWNYQKNNMPDFTKHPVKIDILELYQRCMRFLSWDKIIDELSHLGDEVLYYEDIEFKDDDNLTIKFPSYEKTILNYQECVDAWNLWNE